MRRIDHLGLGATLGLCLATAACAASGPGSAPPRVDIPIPPALPEPKASTPTQPPPAASGKCDVWTAEIVRHEKTSAVAKCQVVPVDVTSQMVVEERAPSPSGLAVRVVQDREAGDGEAPAPVLDGKSYVVETTPKGIDVRDVRGAPVMDPEASRVRRIAASALGWPGADLAAHRPSQGADVPALARAVAALVDASVHGSPPSEARTTARFTGARHESWGEVLAFDVKVSTTESDAGMCHRWTNEAKLAGELLLRPADGALVSLRLRGPVTNAEALCPEGAKQSGQSAAPKTCNRGEITFEVHQPCFAGP